MANTGNNNQATSLTIVRKPAKPARKAATTLAATLQMIAKKRPKLAAKVVPTAMADVKHEEREGNDPSLLYSKRNGELLIRRFV